MTALADATDPRFTAAQLDHLARFEAAVAPAEVTQAAVIEEVARAIAESDGVNWDNYLTGMLGLPCDYRRNATAAVAAYRATQDGGAEEALRRVDRILRDVEDGWEPSAARLTDAIRRQIRAALAPQAGAGQ